MWTKTLNHKGIMLVEVLMAMAILFIIIFSFSELFTLSYSGIYNAGYKSEGLFKAQQKMENALADISYVDPEGEVTRTSNRSITITSLNSGSLTLYGTEINVIKGYTESNGLVRNITLSYFIPY